MSSMSVNSVFPWLLYGAVLVLIVGMPEVYPVSGGAGTFSSSGEDNTERYRRGRNLYRQNCAACHGFDRRGNPPQIPSLREIDERRSKSYVLKVIRNGRGMMPPFRYLSEEEREAIVYYLFHADEREE